MSTPPVIDRRIACALGIAVGTMATELVAGFHFKSFALVSDGYHFATHVGVFAVTAAVAVFTRHPRVRGRIAIEEQRAHAGSAIFVAAATALSATYSFSEAIAQLVRPDSAPMMEAVLVGLLGLVSNLATAYLLRPLEHGDDEHAHHEAHSRAAAFGHALLDALSSGVAVVAIVLSSRFHWSWADSAVGVLGSIIAIVWAIRVARTAVQVLANRPLSLEIQES